MYISTSGGGGGARVKLDKLGGGGGGGGRASEIRQTWGGACPKRLKTPVLEQGFLTGVCGLLWVNDGTTGSTNAKWKVHYFIFFKIFNL